MKKRPTQADVAKLAGVSTATVSYVVNRQTEGRIPISPVTRDRVLAAVAELGYQPDARARSLRSGGTEIIELIIPDMRNPHYWEIAEGVEEEAYLAGYELLLASTSIDPQREVNRLHALTRRRVDAVILTLSFVDQSRDLLDTLSKQRYPIVTLGAPVSQLDWVETGFADATPKLLNHLYALGHRRIGFIYGVGRTQLATNRITLFREWHVDHGLPLDERLVESCGNALEDGLDTCRRLLAVSPRPTAVVVVNDLLAIGAMRAVQETGLRVPEDISVAGFDDIYMTAYLNPSLTTVHANAREIGRMAAKMALQRIREPALPVQHGCVEAEFVPRESTGPVPKSID